MITKSALALTQPISQAAYLATVDLRLALGPGTRSIMQSLGWVIRTAADATSTVPSTTPDTLPSSSDNGVVVIDTSTVPVTTTTMGSTTATTTASVSTSTGPASTSSVGPSQKARRQRAVAAGIF